VRIWHQSMGSVQMNNVGGPITEHARKVVEDGTEVVVHGLSAPADCVTSVESIKNGTAPAGAVTTIDVIGSAYLYNITLRQAIETARQAEREGYDAYVIGSWTDPNAARCGRPSTSQSCPRLRRACCSPPHSGNCRDTSA
jgi:allantoin racemase